MVGHDDITLNRTFDVFMPEKVTQKTALFFIHGGGWTNGTKVDYHLIMRAYCERGFVCGSASYRLLSVSASNSISAVEQLADCRECYDGFVSFLKENDLPTDIAVFGTSAGAHLASLLICAEPGECQEKCSLKNKWIKPVCGMLQSTPAFFEPWPETYPAMWGMMERAAGGRFEEAPEKYRNLSLDRLIRPENPPLFFMEAEIEDLFPSKYNKVLLEKHRSWGIPSEMKFYKGEHGFFYNLTRPVQLEAFEDIIQFVQKIN